MHRDITSSPEYRQALQRYQQGDLPAAYGLCSRLDQRVPGQPAVLELFAAVALGLGQTDQACTKLQEQVKLQKKNASAHSNLSMALYAAGRIPEALKQAQKAIRLEPGLAQAHNNLANAYKRLGDLNRASTAYRRSLALGVNDPRVTMNLSETLYQQGNLEEAAKLAEEAAGKAPAFAPAFKNLGAICLQQGRTEEAQAHLKKALDLDPSDLDARANMAMLKLALFEPEEAQRDLEEVLVADPRHAGALLNLGIIREDQAKTIAAKECYAAAIDAEPGLSAAYANLARLLFEEGREQEARHLLKRALQESAGTDQIYLDWASYEELANNLAQARELLNKIKNKEAFRGERDWLQARLHIRNKAFEPALEILRSIDPDRLVMPDSDSGMFFDLGKVYDKLGRYPEAYAAYERANETKNRRKGRFYDEELDTQTNLRIREVFSAENWTRLQSGRLTARVSGPQPIFIVGFPRSGTSLLEQILGMHPDITPLGELDGLTRIVTNSYKRPLRAQDRYPEGLLHAMEEREGLEALLHEYRDFYLETARGAVDYADHATWFTDKLPHNAPHIGLIRLVFPESPIVYMARHPLDSCLSAYFSNFSAGHSYTAGLESTARHYQNVTTTYRAVKSQTGMQTLEVKYEALVRQQEPEVRRILDFLDLPWESTCLQHENSSRKVRTGSYEQVTEKIYTSAVDRHLNYLPALRPVIPLLKETIERNGYEVPGQGSD